METSRRSPLVSFIAWCVIIASGLAAFFALIQATVLIVLVSPKELEETVLQAHTLGMLPAFALVFVQNLTWIVLAAFAVSALFFYGGVALLRRADWARKTLIAVLVLTLLAGVALIFAKVDIAALPVPENMKATLAYVQDIIMIVNLFFCCVHAWLIWKLGRPAIRAEFSSAVTTVRT